MIEVIGISFTKDGQAYYFLPNNVKITKNSCVIVETERGLQFGYVRTQIIQVDVKTLKSPLKKIIRIADFQDKKKNEKNVSDAVHALKSAKKIVENSNIKMQLIDASYTFDRDKLVFRFLSESRIDFRELARELANKYRTRIELRQIGARDKAKEIGGCGQCGRSLCCNKFLNSLDSVSINMAKNQNVSLNPNKINGLCGRLLCCLAYEDESYKICRKKLPIIGQTIKTEHGVGKVISIDILSQKYKVEIPKVGIYEVEVCNECN